MLALTYMYELNYVQATAGQDPDQQQSSPSWFPKECSITPDPHVTDRYKSA